jgi:hypothetical protein
MSESSREGDLQNNQNDFSPPLLFHFNEMRVIFVQEDAWIELDAFVQPRCLPVAERFYRALA